MERERLPTWSALCLATILCTQVFAATGSFDDGWHFDGESLLGVEPDGDAPVGGGYSVRVSVRSDLVFPRVPMDPVLDFRAMPGRLDPNSIKVIDVATGETVPSAIEYFEYGDRGRVEWVIVYPSHQEYDVRFKTCQTRPALVPRTFTPAIGVGDLLRYNANEPRPITPIMLTGLVDMTGDGKRDLFGVWNYAHRPGDPWTGAVYFPRVGSTEEFVFGDMVRLPGLPAQTYSEYAAGDLNGDGNPDLVYMPRNAKAATFYLNTGERTPGGIPTFAKAGVISVTGADWMPVRIVDLDGDGALDFTFGKWRNYSEGKIAEGANRAVLVRNANAQGWPFTPGTPVGLALTGIQPDWLDMDRDGRFDAVCLIADPEPAGVSAFRVGWQRNLGGRPPRFGPAQLLSTINKKAWRPRLLAAVRDGERTGVLVLTYDFERVMFFELVEPKAGRPQFRYFATAQSRSAVMSLSDQSAPFVCDWDGDGDRDLLVGGGYGWPRIVINRGSNEVPRYDEAQLILSEGRPIRIVRDAILGPPECWHDMGYIFPAYVDWDSDGLPDLVLGNETNRVFWYGNTGTRTAPLFGQRRQVIVDGYPDSPALRTKTAKLVASHPHVYPKNEHQPFYWRTGLAFVDFNGDGLMDMAARQWSKYSFGRFMRYRDPEGMLRLNRASVLRTTDGNQFHGTRLNVVDWDGDGLWDIVYSRATNRRGTDTIFLARNVRTNARPAYEPPRPLRFFGQPIYITRHGPHPWVGDFDGDSKPDMLCYTEWSTCPFYAHAAIEMKERPKLALSRARRLDRSPLKTVGVEPVTGQLSVAKREVIMENKEEQLHFPFLHEAADGMWYMTYREGPHGAPGGDRVQCRQSNDRGVTWQPWPGLTAEPLLRLFRARLRDGTLISHRYQLDAGEGSERRAYILRSRDEGRTWSRQPAPVGGLPFDPKRFLGLWGRVVEMLDGHLLCTLHGYRPNEGKYSLGVVESTDGGHNWRYLSSMCDDGTLGREGPDEADLVLLKPGKLLSVFRTGSNLFQVTSTDGGRTWSDPGDLGTYGVSPQLLLLHNGVLILAYGTRNVCVRASWDGTGETWSEPLVVYRGPGSGYTDLQALSADHFRLVYDESPFHGKAQGLWGRIARVEVSASPERKE